MKTLKADCLAVFATNNLPVRARLTACLLFIAVAVPLVSAKAQNALLVARYEMSPAPGNSHQVADSGPFHRNAALKGSVTFVNGPPNMGQALHFPGNADSFAQVENSPEVNRTINQAYTITAWINPDSIPSRPKDTFHQFAGIFSTHDSFHSAAAELGLDSSGHLAFLADAGWDESPSAHAGLIKTGQWQHIAVTYQTGGDRVLYIDGNAVDTRHVAFPTNVDTEGIWIGKREDIGFAGAIGRISIYQGALTAEQVKADMNGSIQATQAQLADIPAPLQRVNLLLTRFDEPLGLKTDYAPTRQSVRRVPRPNAVDWPTITVDGKPVFTKDSSETITIPLRGTGANSENARFSSVFHVDGDTAVMPGNHWMRAVAWLWNRKDIYTVDREARGSNDVTAPNYELLTFPIVIKGKIQSVTLTSDGQTIYQRSEPLDSLTLALPGAKYQLSVNGAPAQEIETGLEPIVVGQPRDIMKKVSLSFADGTTVSMPSAIDSFTNQKDWNTDTALMAAAAKTPSTDPKNALNRPMPQPFADVPISPMQVHGIDMSHGMSGGWYMAGEQGPPFTGDINSFAAHVADLGYDQVIREMHDGWENNESFLSEQWLNALAQHGVKGGIYPITLSDSNLPIFYYDLADYHGPAYRDMQLVVQRFASYPNFMGTYFGGDNGSYTRFWDWSPPKTRWAEAFENLMSWQPNAVVGPEVRTGPAPYDHSGSERDFLDFVHKYDQTWGTYGQLSHAATDIMPDAVVTIGSFGSAAGVFGTGGWIATVPGKLIFDGMSVQMAYDWNELNTSKPMQLSGLIDRLNSDHPTTPTWAQVDDFWLLFSREARQRAYALALTRGVASIGGNFLANGQNFPDSPQYNSAPARAAVVNDYRDLHKWIHTYGGAYAGTKPDAKIAILFVEDQAISRGLNSPPLKGPQEGKTTEALFICEAAGWPAKIVTPDELKRGLDPSVSALLLVGLNKIDNTWSWSDGLEDPLRQFVARGGKILTDDESVSPLPSTATGLRVMDFLNQVKSPPAVSPSIQLFERNKANIGLLQTAMKGAEPAVAVSDNPTIWAVPHTTGDVQYVTVVNWGYKPGTNADQQVVPQTGNLAWHTTRPIYDVRAGKLITSAQAAQVDLTKDGFCLYALPPKPVDKPTLSIQGAMATVDVGGVKGIPVRLEVHANGMTTTVYAASGTPAKLPLDDSHENQVQATELLSGQTSDLAKADSVPTLATTGHGLDEATRLTRFWTRKEIPVVVALTAAQVADPKMTALADRVVSLLKSHGRDARVGHADPTDVVRSIQVAQSINLYPKWQTDNVDLVLFGSAADNVLIFDQQRGCLLPPKPQEGQTLLTFSPFVGGYQTLNLLGTNPTTLSAAVDTLGQ